MTVGAYHAITLDMGRVPKRIVEERVSIIKTWGYANNMVIACTNIL